VKSESYYLLGQTHQNNDSLKERVIPEFFGVERRKISGILSLMNHKTKIPDNFFRFSSKISGMTLYF